jgi:hypothetical protein
MEQTTSSTTTTVEHAEHAEAAPVQEQPKLPETTPDGTKVYPTSFLPAKSHMEVSRIPTAKLTGFEIEVTHVVIFVLLTVFLFIGMWRKSSAK